MQCLYCSGHLVRHRSYRLSRAVSGGPRSVKTCYPRLPSPRGPLPARDGGRAEKRRGGGAGSDPRIIPAAAQSVPCVGQMGALSHILAPDTSPTQERSERHRSLSPKCARAFDSPADEVGPL
ncbi:hypothetical protein AAFF_G00146660 [Aldrovandia affinis]|uniref:Uncharacterized protein n=1 Tax=Aldrovandia affinis TaxID=143900 RepID=A0AAD7W944_9TELE|nr:hypothetical protein AAFF_G00146660 [Aldrovandia affinis]